jgi:hypothetical protein
VVLDLLDTDMTARGAAQRAGSTTDDISAAFGG